MPRRVPRTPKRVPRTPRLERLPKPRPEWHSRHAYGPWKRSYNANGTLGSGEDRRTIAGPGARDFVRRVIFEATKSPPRPQGVRTAHHRSSSVELSGRIASSASG